MSVRIAFGRGLCVVALAGVVAFWAAEAQDAATEQASRFTGESRTLEADGWRISRRYFARGAYTAWHRHPGGQLLFVESGRARVQERGGPMRELAVGDTHLTGPDVEHWHGATPDSDYTQVALARGNDTVWLEKVSAAEYAGR